MSRTVTVESTEILTAHVALLQKRQLGDAHVDLNRVMVCT